MTNEQKVFETINAVTGFSGDPVTIECTRNKGKADEKNYKVVFNGFNKASFDNELVATWAFEKLNGLFAQTTLTKYIGGNSIETIEAIIEKLAGGGGINSPLMQYLRTVAQFFKESYKKYNKPEFFSAITPMAIKSAILGYSSVDFTVNVRNKEGVISVRTCSLKAILDSLHSQQPALIEIYNSIVNGIEEEEEIIFDID